MSYTDCCLLAHSAMYTSIVLRASFDIMIIIIVMAKNDRVAIVQW